MTPAVLLAAYAAGILMAWIAAPGKLGGAGITIGVLMLAWGALRLARWGWVPFLGLLLMAGFLNATLALQPPAGSDHVSRFADLSPLRLEGSVISLESRPSGGYRLLLKMHQVTSDQGTVAVSGDLLLYIKTGTPQARPGQVVSWRSALRRPVSYGNPGEFDYPLYLAAQGIHVTAFIADAEQLVTLVNHPQEHHATIENWRHLIAGHIEQTVPARAAGLLKALLLGMRGGIGGDLRQVLAESGVAHLFAISGLHFGLLALLLYQAGKWLYTRSTFLLLWCPPQKILPVVLMIPLTAYLFLTGNAWATRRAFLTVAIIALLFLRGRRTPPFALLAFVALCLLLFEPLALFQPGFQLSFAGAAGIITWLPSWQPLVSRLARPLRWSLAMIMTTTAATLATAPATLWHFHQFAPAGLLTNLVAIPLIAWGAVPAGLFGMALLPFCVSLADGGLLLAARLTNLALDLVSAIITWPGLAVIPIYLTTSRLILLLGGLLLLLPCGRGQRHALTRLGILLLALGAAWLMLPQSADFRVVALSVGQGDATLITMAGNRHYLIDGGGLPGSSIDPGEQLIAPALGRMGIDSLQGVILTHNHPDHSDGLKYILRRFAVAHFYHAGSSDELAPELLDALQKRDVQVHHGETGWTALPSEAHQSLFLFTPKQSSPDINERAIAVFAAQQDQGVLLTADLGVAGLRQLQAASIPGRVTLLKLPHHGSRHAHPEQYLDWLKPTAAFVSAGRGNPYGFPHQQAIAACSSRQVPLFRTDRDGMLAFSIVNGRWLARPGRAL